MKSYKDGGIVNLGYSDIAQLTMVVFDGEDILRTAIRFGQDGRYKAYLIGADCPIPDHYRLVEEYWTSGDGWVWIFDDDRKTFTETVREYIKVYRAGDLGCIIQIA